MSANNKLIQAKNLIGQILQNDGERKEIPSEDTTILRGFLEGKETIARAIRSIQNIKKLPIN